VFRRQIALIDHAVPALVGAVIVSGELLHGGHSARPLALALALAAASVLWARRRWPGLTLAVSGLLAAALVHIDGSAGIPAVLAPAVALYSLALTRTRRTQLLAGVATVGAVLAAELLHHGHPAHPEHPSLLQTLGHVLLVAIPLLAAAVVRAHRSYLSLLTERFKLAEQAREQETERRAEQERMRIARELHDVVAHTLTTINVQAATAGQLLDRNPGLARSALDTIEHSSRDAINELRAILGVLRGRESAGAPRKPAPGIDDLAELVRRARNTGLDVELDVTGAPPERLSEAVSLATFRIVQESLTNARRHAADAPVQIRLDYGARRIALVVENGAGTSRNGASNGATPGIGISGMSERATALGGTLRAAPTATGFRVDAQLPYTLA
jgi:signal transduction histidine kinase